MVLSTTQMRREHGAPCKVKNWRGAQGAWDALISVFEYYGYLLRKADSGSRACREITGGSDYSLHAYFLQVAIRLWNLGITISGGLAADFNWQSNPYGKRLVTDMLIRKDGILMPDRIEGIRTNNGKQVFRWGGYYRGNKDGMHYELVCSNEDLATGIDPSTLPGQAEPEPILQEEDMKILYIADGPHQGQYHLSAGTRLRYIPNPTVLDGLRQAGVPEDDISGAAFEWLFGAMAEAVPVLVQVHADRVGELPERMRDAMSSGAWLYVDAKEFWWCPTVGHADENFRLGLAANARPYTVSPSFIKEKRPRCSADLDPNSLFEEPSTKGHRGNFFTADGRVHAAATGS